MNQRNSSGHLGYIVAGIAAGFIGSRLLAPLLATANGSVRARMGEDGFDKLMKDHRLISATLRKMEETPSGNIATRTGLFLTLKRTLAKHALAEEDIVYPLLHREAGHITETKQLYDEHADMKIHLYELEQLLKANADWSARVRSLRQLIEDHIREEEEVEFPRLRRALDEQRNKKLTAQVHREESMVL